MIDASGKDDIDLTDVVAESSFEPILEAIYYGTYNATIEVLRDAQKTRIHVWLLNVQKINF
jgi:hypothetical protein